VGHYLVPIEGDADRAAGLLALAGLQNIREGQQTVARVRADDEEKAIARVRVALESEPFLVKHEATLDR
jgi:hypothetical protein